MPYQLLKYGFRSKYTEPRMFHTPPTLKKRYDVVVIGAGAHGLAAAYYLAADHGITNVAVLERHYIGSGGTGRNTAIIRANYMTPESVRFYSESVRLFQRLSDELDFNIFYSERGQYIMLHTDAQVRVARRRAEVSKQFGFHSEIISTDELLKVCPHLDLTCGNKPPIIAVLYHPPGATARHDAVAWAYGRAASRHGAEIHQQTEVTGIRVEGGRALGVETSRGYIEAGAILSCVAGHTPTITKMAGVYTPLHIRPLQACVTEPLKPWLNIIMGSAQLQLYLSQTSRGELIMGSALDPYELHCNHSTLTFSERLASDLLSLFPFLAEVKIMRQWSGLCDLSPDSAPVMGLTPVGRFYLDAGWGTWGFKATPISGKTMAETVAKDRAPDLIQAYRLSRFEEMELVDEKGSSSIAH